MNTSYELSDEGNEGGIREESSINEVQVMSLDQIEVKMLKFKNIKHRSLCKIIDIEYDNQSNEKQVYFMTEAYNASLLDLYKTNKNENMEFQEEQLIEIAFQILKGLAYLNQRGLNLKGMLRMQHIHLDEQIWVNTYKLEHSDLVFTAPETLNQGLIGNQSDLWSLGMILLICMSLEFEPDSFNESMDILTQSLHKIKDESLFQQINDQKAAHSISDYESPQMNKEDSRSDFDSDSNINQNEEESLYWRLIHGDFIDKNKYSSKFLNFLKLCLTLSPYRRLQPIQILSHPVFYEQNYAYMKSQIILTGPVTSLEKQHLKSIRANKKIISHKMFLEIAKLKACQDYPSFLEFLKSSMGTTYQFNNLLKPKPIFFRTNNSGIDHFQQLKLNDQNHIKHSSSIMIIRSDNNQTQKVQQIVLKPEIGEDLLIAQSSDTSINEEAKSILNNNSQPEMDKKESSQSLGGLISDQMSVQSSIMDRISSIFTLGRQAPPVQQPITTANQQKSAKGQKSESGKDKEENKNSPQIKSQNPLKRYIIISKFIDSSACSQTKLCQILRKNSDILKECHFLRRKIWTRLLSQTHSFTQYILDLSNYHEITIPQKEIQQVWSDIKRCEHFHPLLQLDQVKKRLHNLIIQFLILNQDACYIQGLDSITVVLYTEFIEQESQIIPMLKQIYQNYLKHFIIKEQNTLSFTYPCLLVQRLLSFFDPELFNHFKSIGFTHNLYLVCWVMTLFAHTLPISQVVNIWTDLFCEKVEYLFFITLAILQQLKDKLLLLDLNNTLSMINNISGLIQIEQVLIISRDLMSKTPQSFIAGDFVFDTSKQGQNLEMLKQNEYFAQRWWELEYLDYREDIEVCIINCEDAMNLKKSRIFIDIRNFESYHQVHLKSSYHMDSTIKKDEGDKSQFKLYCDFIQAYNETQPDNFIILIGDKNNYGHQFALDIIQENQSVGRICILKGGIDALTLENFDQLRKGQKNQTAKDFLQQYERFVKKVKTHKAIKAQTGTANNQNQQNNINGNN